MIEEPFAIKGKSSDFPAFGFNTFNDATLYVPAGTIDKYKATAGWQDFGNIEEIEASEVTEAKATPVLIQCEGNGLMVNGAKAGTAISVYDFSGKLVGNTTATEGMTRVQVASSEKVLIVKVGERSLKVLMK